MKIKDLGEFALIDVLKKNMTVNKSVFKGIGDDCAVLQYKSNKYLLLTSDMIIEDVHFKKNNAPAWKIGHKAMAVNISDIAACGGKPKWAVVSIGLPRNTDALFVKKLYAGIEKISSKYDIVVVGGDTNASKKIHISIALLGMDMDPVS